MSYILVVISIIALIYSTTYWIKNPELSEMQMLLKFWWAYGITLVCVMGVFLLNIDEEHIF